jgi:acyl-CoA synthetase (AMP-forming)/AMP-acid ligase II
VTWRDAGVGACLASPPATRRDYRSRLRTLHGCSPSERPSESGPPGTPRLQIQSLQRAAVRPRASCSSQSQKERPKAIVTLKEGATATEADIIAFCRERLAHYKCPDTVTFGPLPKTSTGKVQKFLLREPEWAGRDRRIN